MLIKCGQRAQDRSREVSLHWDESWMSSHRRELFLISTQPRWSTTIPFPTLWETAPGGACRLLSYYLFSEVCDYLLAFDLSITCCLCHHRKGNVFALSLCIFYRISKEVCIYVFIAPAETPLRSLKCAAMGRGFKTLTFLKAANVMSDTAEMPKNANLQWRPGSPITSAVFMWVQCYLSEKWTVATSANRKDAPCPREHHGAWMLASDGRIWPSTCSVLTTREILALCPCVLPVSFNGSKH